jgi:hypothetical protein
MPPEAAAALKSAQEQSKTLVMPNK